MRNFNFFVFFDLYGFENGAERYRHALGLLEAERNLGYSFDRLLSDAGATQEDWEDLQRTKDDAAILLSIEHEPVG